MAKGTSHPALIKPALLRWARESSFLTLEEAAHAAHISRPEKLDAAERGDVTISFRQAQHLAHHVRIPLSTLYLAEPPDEGEMPPDFRAMGRRDALQSFEVVKVLRETRQRAQAAVTLVSGTSLARTHLPEHTQQHADEITQLLVPLVCVPAWSDDLRRSLGDHKSGRALNQTKTFVEERLGVFVFESPIDPDLYFRGCALVVGQQPAIVLSSKDHLNARRFTLVHEVVHLIMRQMAFCEPAVGQQHDLERFCDEIAGNALMPKDLVLSDAIRPHSTIDPQDLVSAVARKFYVSHSSAAVRLSQLGIIPWSETSRLLNLYRLLWQKEREEMRDSKGGPHPYGTRVRWLGPTFTQAVLHGLDSDVLSITRAAALLGVSPSYDSIRGVREKYVEAYG